MFPAFWNAIINRGLEQEKRLAALKTKVKRLLREKAANVDSQKGGEFFRLWIRRLLF